VLHDHILAARTDIETRYRFSSIASGQPTADRSSWKIAGGQLMAYTGVMASAIQQHPTTPKRAARQRSKLDRLLDPDFFKVLGEPTRARLFACLVKCGRPCSVTEVAECCSIDFSMVARHLGALARAGVLDASKEGRTVWYSAKSGEIAARLRDLANAIDEWRGEDACDTGGGCCG